MSPDPNDDAQAPDPRFYRDAGREWGAPPDDPGTAWRERRAAAHKARYDTRQARIAAWLWAAVAMAWVTVLGWLAVKYGVHHG